MINYTVLESDWKLFRKKIPVWQEIYINKLNNEYIAILKTKENPSEIFWKLEERINKDKKSVGVMIIMKRSLFLSNILALLSDEVITIDELDEFSDELKEIIKNLLPVNELKQVCEGNDISWDSELTEYGIEKIKKESLENFYNKATNNGNLKDFEFEPERLLYKLRLLKNDKLTNAGYYLFSNDNPVTMKMAIFATDEKLTFLDINRVSGNIIDLIEKANLYVKKNIRWQANTVGLYRIETPEIPIKALREIICNSFAHARYNLRTEHEIDIHPGFIKIYNPGEFPIGYKPEDFIEDNVPSMIRNPLILKTLFLSDDVESYSSGFRRVYDECDKNNVKIEYIISREGFAFIFKRNVVNVVVNPIVNDCLSETEKLLIKLIRAEPYISAAKLSEKINMSIRNVQRHLSALKDKQVIERIGGTRGYWKVLRLK